MKSFARGRRRTLAGALPGAWLLAFALLGLGCARPMPQDRADAAERAACGQHADMVYSMQNPDEVYRDDTYATSTLDAPFAGAGMARPPSAGLSGQFQRQQMVADCLRGGGGTVGAAPAGPAPEEESPSQAPAQP